jgi:hypothetical protein
MYDEAAQYDKAIDARKIIEMNLKNELAVFNLGIMFPSFSTDEAVQAFRDALSLPDYAPPSNIATAIPRQAVKNPSRGSSSTPRLPLTIRWVPQRRRRPHDA